MSSPKPNLTPAQRKAYDAKMKQLRQQQQKRRKVKTTTQRSAVSDLLLGKLPVGTDNKTLKKLQKDARIQRRKSVRALREKHNKTTQEKQFLANVRKMRQQKRRQKMINEQRRDAQNRVKTTTQVTKLKAPPRPTRLTGATRSYVKVRARGRG